MKQTRLRGPERRARFLDAAAEIVIEHGVFAVTMDGVAQRTGVAKSLGYRYFADRDALLVALLDRENKINFDRLADELPPNASFEDWVRGACKLSFRRGDERGELFTRLISDNGPLAERAKAGQRLSARGWADERRPKTDAPDSLDDIVVTAQKRSETSRMPRSPLPL
jgi:AcrR family transcriptional regulator